LEWAVPQSLKRGKAGFWRWVRDDDVGFLALFRHRRIVRRHVTGRKMRTSAEANERLGKLWPRVFRDLAAASSKLFV
jgi:hypothetical protein